MDLLEPYTAPDSAVSDTAREALEQEIDSLRKPIASAGWTVSVGPHENGEQWIPRLATVAVLPEWGEHLTIACRPASVSNPSARTLRSGTKVSEQFEAVALETLTSFVAIEISGEVNGARLEIRFLVNAELGGAPANRRDRLLRHMLQDKRSVLRFLLLLLSDFAENSLVSDPNGNGAWKKSLTLSAGESEALLEPLLRALDRQPVRLTAISTLLADLGSTEEGRALIPEGLPDLFRAIWSAKDLVTND